MLPKYLRWLLSIPRLSHVSLRASRGWLLVGLLLATAIWGWAFVGVGAAVAAYPVVGFLFLRFVVGGAALTVVARMRQRRPTTAPPGPSRRMVLGLGALLTFGYVTQVYGLQLGVSPATAGVLAGLVVVLVPIGEWVAFRRVPGASTWMAAALVLAGTGLIAAPTPVTPGPHGALGLGLLLEVVGAAAFAFQIVLLGRVGQTHDPVRLAAGQLRTVAMLLLPLLPLT
ncbi:MAG TPA: DMT family transporter, partial [Candidatus Dormibacteraeota bacterium]|nr:DMT family transporter [Candidatus Dormibacteraeota bacterium]